MGQFRARRQTLAHHLSRNKRVHQHSLNTHWTRNNNENLCNRRSWVKTWRNRLQRNHKS